MGFPQSAVQVIWALILIGGIGGCASTGVPPSDKLAPPDMVFIPAGTFMMGSELKNGLGILDAGVDETPQHKRYLKAFWMDQYEVNIRQYRAFVQARGHRPPSVWNNANYPSPIDSHPVIDVSWFDADTYCHWAEKRLPTEAEWEKAARGATGNIWPWGDSPSPEKVSALTSQKNWTVPVGSVPADISPYGVYDMGKNAMEWTADWYQAYPKSTLKRMAFGEKYRVMKGGAWNTPLLPFSRSANRHAVAPHWHHPSHGFRCAKDT